MSEASAMSSAAIGLYGTRNPRGPSARTAPLRRPALATEANRWLSLTRSPLRLSGHPATTTRLEDVEHPDAVLCRTNGGAMAEVLHQMEGGRHVAMAGGGGALATAAQDLKSGRGTRRPTCGRG
ncbi:hypothetical protein ABT150_53135 [Streptomyces mirabilis]|uniref:hypothetical protein n=1 Tax=Streptomyces mirabilis TaxID=68239 RepID=UPI003329E4B9